MRFFGLILVTFIFYGCASGSKLISPSQKTDWQDAAVDSFRAGFCPVAAFGRIEMVTDNTIHVLFYKAVIAETRSKIRSKSIFVVRTYFCQLQSSYCGFKKGDEVVGDAFVNKISSNDPLTYFIDFLSDERYEDFPLLRLRKNE